MPTEETETQNIEGQTPFTQAPDNPAEDKAEPWGEQTRIVGRRHGRIDGFERVSGGAVYPSDVSLPGLLHAAILGCPYPHARIKGVDASAALKLPGVHAVISSADADANPEWHQGGRIFNDTCRYEGEPVAAVAADNPYIAADALKRILVSYEELPYVSDMESALADGAPKVHPDGNTVKTDSYSRGDLKQGLEQAAVQVSGQYRTASEMQTPLERHGCVARWEGDQLTVWESTQGVYAVQSRIAETLGLPLTRVRVIGHYMGGAFGSKLDAGGYSIIASVLAKRTGRPVKLFVSREQTLLTMGNRPPTRMDIRLAARQDGGLTAIEFTGRGASGAYSAGGASLLDWLAKDLYQCDNVATELEDVYINAGPARPFRAPGYVQCAFAVEQAMDALAEKLNMDPVALRLKNIPKGSPAKDNLPYTTDGLRLCIEQGAQHFGWEAARAEAAKRQDGPIKRGVGMAAANWFVGDGGPPCTVIVRLYADGTANLNMGASDIGTGTRTVMAMVVAEELGLELDAISVENADTGTCQYATPSGGSKTVPTEAPTVRRACLAVKDQLLDMAAKQLGAGRDQVVFAGSEIRTADGFESLKIRDLDRLSNQKVVVGLGERRHNPDDVSITPFAAQFCELEVNTRTGEVKLLRMLGANESGRVINRLTWDNQLIGGVTMGIGFALTEGRVLDGPTGKLCNANWHDYKLPTALDIPPELISDPVMLNDDQANIVGAKGLGEPVTIPTAPAIANAIYHATGVRPMATPINPLDLLPRLNQET